MLLRQSAIDWPGPATRSRSAELPDAARRPRAAHRAHAPQPVALVHSPQRVPPAHSPQPVAPVPAEPPRRAPRCRPRFGPATPRRPHAPPWRHHFYSRPHPVQTRHAQMRSTRRPARRPARRPSPFPDALRERKSMTERRRGVRPGAIRSALPVGRRSVAGLRGADRWAPQSRSPRPSLPRRSGRATPGATAATAIPQPQGRAPCGRTSPGASGSVDTGRDASRRVRLPTPAGRPPSTQPRSPPSTHAPGAASDASGSRSVRRSMRSTDSSRSRFLSKQGSSVRTIWLQFLAGGLPAEHFGEIERPGILDDRGETLPYLGLAHPLRPAGAGARRPLE